MPLPFFMHSLQEHTLTVIVNMQVKSRVSLNAQLEYETLDPTLTVQPHDVSIGFFCRVATLRKMV